MTTPPKPDYVERPTLSAEQVRAFLESTKDHRLHALWVVILMQGLQLRRGLRAALAGHRF